MKSIVKYFFVIIAMIVFISFPALADSKEHHFTLKMNSADISKHFAIALTEDGKRESDGIRCKLQDGKSFLTNYNKSVINFNYDFTLKPKRISNDKKLYLYDFLEIRLSDNNEVIGSDGEIYVQITKEKNDFTIDVIFDVVSGSDLTSSMMSNGSIYMIMGGLMLMIMIPSCIWVCNRYGSCWFDGEK